MRTPILLALSLALMGCGQADPALTVTNATIAASPNRAAIYATIRNRGGPDSLIAIEIDGRVPITLHETSMDGGVMRMRAVQQLDLPVEGTLELKSGGAHGMAMGEVTANSPSIPLTFRFARNAPITVNATVTGPGGMPMEHGH